MGCAVGSPPRYALLVSQSVRDTGGGDQGGVRAHTGPRPPAARRAFAAFAKHRAYQARPEHRPVPVTDQRLYQLQPAISVGYCLYYE
jgi:hypothetical protein